MKKLLFCQRSETPHWVGDGFPVRTLFSYHNIARKISPFLLMDYAGPTEFSPSDRIRGVGEHPHRGFETVTLVYAGEVEHRDSAGGGGQIGPGDVQCMTAASGLVHEEKHGKEFAKVGGQFEMIQLWVNLPAKDKMAKPKYQGILNHNIPRIQFENNGGYIRIIAGEYEGNKGPAQTFTRINMWDVILDKNHVKTFQMPVGDTCLVFVLEGKVKLNSGEILNDAELGVLDPSEENFELTAIEKSKILILGGTPLNEPIIGYGPFVMNTTEEIAKAFEDFNKGLMGKISPIEGSSF